MSSISVLLAVALTAAPPLPQAVQEKERGDRLAANGDTAGAREAFTNAARLSPGYAAPLNELGILLVNEEKLPEAIEQFHRAISRDPSFALAYNNMGFVLRKMARFSEAVEAYNSYTSLTPKDPAGWFGLGEAQKGAGNQVKALEAYQKCAAVAADQKNEKFQAKAEAAAAPLQKALGVAAPQPSDAAAPADVAATPERAAFAVKRISEGLAARTAGRLRDSLSALQEASNADPGNVQAVFETGKAYAMLGSFPPAIERWQRVLTMKIDEATRAAAQQNIERAQQKMAASSEAPAQPLEATPPVTPEQPKAPQPLTPEAQLAYNTGVQLYGQKKYAEALQELNRALALKADFAHAFAARGSTYFAMHEYVRALNDYGQAMRLDHNMASPLFGVAESYNALGRKSEAIPYYQAYAASKAPDVQASLQEVAKRRIGEHAK